MTKKDTIFAAPHTGIKDFAFDKMVVEVFPDMIKRSVPGYTTIIEGIGELAKRFAQPHSLIYDLGCSLGAASLSVRKSLSDQGNSIIAIDNSPAMVERCRLVQSGYSFPTPIEIIEADITELSLEPCSMVILNFTLQFLKPTQRLKLLSAIYDALLPGGCLVLSEKISFTHKELEQDIIDLHHDFKRHNGYSDMEISQKRAALENVMIPDNRETHYERFKEIGFSSYDTWFQHYNFVSFLAIK